MPTYCEGCARLRRTDTCSSCGQPTYDATTERARADLDSIIARGGGCFDQRLDGILLRLRGSRELCDIARDELARLVHQQPAHGRVQLLFGLACYGAGNLVGALRATSLAVRLAPRRYGASRDPVDALVTWAARERLAQLERGEPDPRHAVELGRLRAHFGDYQGALDAYRAGSSAGEDNLERLASMGLALRLLGKPREAVAVYQRILTREPRFAMAHNNLVAAHADLAEVEAAERAAAAAVELDPTLGSAMVSLGTLYLEVGRLPEAIAALWEADSRDPALFPTAAILRAAAHLLDENGDKARDEIAAASAHPKIHTTPQVGYVRAAACERRGDDGEAAAALSPLWEMAVGSAEPAGGGGS